MLCAMRKIALVVTVLFSLALFGCPDKNATPDPSKTTTPATSAAGSAHPAAAGSASAKGGW
jgi:hypothetical protein